MLGPLTDSSGNIDSGVKINSAAGDLFGEGRCAPAEKPGGLVMSETGTVFEF